MRVRHGSKMRGSQEAELGVARGLAIAIQTDLTFLSLLKRRIGGTYIVDARRGLIYVGTMETRTRSPGSGS